MRLISDITGKMKSPILIKTNIELHKSYYVASHTGQHFNYPFHFHPEYELTYIKEGSGMRFIGNSIEHFGPGDLILVGSNIPHYWRNAQEYYGSSSLRVNAIVVRFLYQLGNSHLFDLPEMGAIRKLLQESAYGIKITGSSVSLVSQYMEDMLSVNDSNNIILLLQTLSAIAGTQDKRYLLSSAAVKPINETDIQRINNIYEYMLMHYTEKISLSEIASVANLQTASFCRYFKERFRKTFTDALNEIRIIKACECLQKNDMPVTQVAFECGFKNLSNFTKVFKKNTGYSPRRYKNVIC